MSNLFGTYITQKFTDIFEDYETFQQGYEFVGLSDELLTDNLERIYKLIYAEFGNSTIANLDSNQFVFKLFSILWQHGPTWAKKVEYQAKIRGLTDEELREGSKNIYNHSYNPSTAPSTDTINELTTIDDQNTSKLRRAKLDAYFQASQYLDQNFTREFLERFRPLFIKIVEPHTELLYGGLDTDD